MKILIVDDQRSARRAIADLLEGVAGCEILEAATLDEARAALGRQAIDVALVDLRLGPDVRNREGMTLVAEIRAHTDAVPIVVTGFAEMGEIRAAMRHGAYAYLLKEELCEDIVIPLIEELRSRRRLEQEVLELRARRHAAPLPVGLVGASPPMERLRAAIRRVATSDRPVLVTGETGTGKELVVQALHALGAHPEDPLLDINCGAIPEPLIEAQLFGHERGAFTGADRRQDGYLAAVRSGTLFLDEVAELPPALQARLLRVLETGRFRPVGSTAESRFTGRVVAATHADLEARVRQGRFRDDLLYRLNVLQVHVPTLEERRQDIPALVAHFAGRQDRPLRFSPEALAMLQVAPWPGNVRQLRNVIDRIAVFADDDVITPASLSAWLGERGSADEALRELARGILRLPIPGKPAAIRRALVSVAIELAGGNKTAAARLLGVHRKAVARLLDKEADPDADGDDGSAIEPPAFADRERPERPPGDALES